MPQEFYRHVSEAIHSNKSRRSYYRQVAGRRAWWTSTILIFTERLTIPIARRFDRMALPFNERGIPVVEDDFVEMSLILPKETPPRHLGEPDRISRSVVRRLTRNARKASMAALKRGNYAIVQQELAAAIHELEAVERQYDLHFAMTKHLLESAGLAALRAPVYIRASSGEAGNLCRKFVALQVKVIDKGIFLDRMAQSSHRKGAGIIVNDVPDIPFLAELAQESR